MGKSEPAPTTLPSPPISPGGRRSPTRLASVDAYRGLVMFLMMAEILKFTQIAKNVPGNSFWEFLAFHQSHVEWVGCSLHDLIQPSFSFLVGVSLPFSLAARRSHGQSVPTMALHAFWRAFVLVWIGIVLRSLWSPIPDYGFTDTLSQIGLGYGFLFLLGLRPVRDQWIAFVVLLIGYWLFFALWPAPGPDFDWASVGVSQEWLKQNGLEGFAAHWSKNANAAAHFDQWFLNQFPREKTFVYSSGGYQVLSFIPTLATMILGLIAGGVLKEGRGPWPIIRWFIAAGLIALAIGHGLGYLGICPVIKRIWTPSWVLFSGGWCFLLLAGFYVVTDVGGWRMWAFPLIVMGTNSIAAYCMSSSFVKPEIHKMVLRHFGLNAFNFLGQEYTLLFHGAATLTVMYLILHWMYKRKVFIKV
jgi:heparan-alpha-glucosaminide N-acetyltransferase